ncbi:hypothetical protein IIA15_02020, partial [candidate division TA06 bacterium]|nr:hypothetical protein [candidate division TA06 bacterium]
MKRILGTFGSYFLFTTLCNKLPYSWREIYFFEYFYLLTAAILLLLSFYFALKSLTQRLRTPPPPSHLETLFRATGFSTVFTLWALYIEIEGIQLVVDILFWFFAYFFYEVLYLRSKYPPKS